MKDRDDVHALVIARDRVNVHLAYLRRVATEEEVELLFRLARRAPPHLTFAQALAAIAKSIDQQGRVGLHALLNMARTTL